MYLKSRFWPSELSGLICPVLFWLRSHWLPYCSQTYQGLSYPRTFALIFLLLTVAFPRSSFHGHLRFMSSFATVPTKSFTPRDLLDSCPLPVPCHPVQYFSCRDHIWSTCFCFTPTRMYHTHCCVPSMRRGAWFRGLQITLCRVDG